MPGRIRRPVQHRAYWELRGMEKVRAAAARRRGAGGGGVVADGGPRAAGWREAVRRRRYRRLHRCRTCGCGAGQWRAGPARGVPRPRPRWRGRPEAWLGCVGRSAVGGEEGRGTAAGGSRLRRGRTTTPAGGTISAGISITLRDGKVYPSQEHTSCFDLSASLFAGASRRVARVASGRSCASVRALSLCFHSVRVRVRARTARQPSPVSARSTPGRAPWGGR